MFPNIWSKQIQVVSILAIELIYAEYLLTISTVIFFYWRESLCVINCFVLFIYFQIRINHDL